MNEEELKIKGRAGKSFVVSDLIKKYHNSLDISLPTKLLMKSAIEEGFQKGKLEQKKEELKRIIELQKKIRRYLIDNSRCDCLELTTKYGDISDVLFWEYEEQLQKEIGGNEK